MNLFQFEEVYSMQMTFLPLCSAALIVANVANAAKNAKCVACVTNCISCERDQVKGEQRETENKRVIDREREKE